MTTRQQMEQLCTYICRQEALYREWARDHGMSYNTIMTLYAVDLAGQCTQKQISEEWLLPKQTVNTVVKDLERRGYLRLEAGRDQKEKRISFTPAGQVYAREHLRELYAAEDRAFASLGDGLCQAMLEGTRAFTEAFTREVRRG